MRPQQKYLPRLKMLTEPNEACKCKRVHVIYSLFFFLGQAVSLLGSPFKHRATERDKTHTIKTR